MCWQIFFLGLVAWSHSFLVFFITYIHTVIHIHTHSFHLLHYRFLIAVRSEDLHWGVETRFELGAALQQPDALPTEPRRTLLSHATSCWSTPHPTDPRRTLLSHTAPYCSTPHPTEPRRKILGSQHFGKSDFYKCLLVHVYTVLYCQPFIQQAINPCRLIRF